MKQPCALSLEYVPLLLLPRQCIYRKLYQSIEDAYVDSGHATFSAPYAVYAPTIPLTSESMQSVQVSMGQPLIA